jgi:hypothetical protein
LVVGGYAVAFHGHPRYTKDLDIWIWVDITADIWEKFSSKYVDKKCEAMSAKKIRELVSRSRIKEALNNAFNILPPHIKDHITLLQAQLGKLEEDVMLGLIGNEEASQRRNKISYALLQLISEKEAVESNDIRQIHYGSGDNIARDKFVISNGNATQTVNENSQVTKTILFAAANPTNEAIIQTDLEHRTIKEEMQKGKFRESFSFQPSQAAVRITDLIRAFKNFPTIIHFAGHGTQIGILVSDDQNKSQLLSDAAIERLFKPLKGKTELVLLNSCYSTHQAEFISKMGMIVIGHNLPIGDSAAISFSKGFYLGLSEGLSYQDALNDGLTIVLAEADAYASVIEVWKDGIKLNW